MHIHCSLSDLLCRCVLSSGAHVPSRADEGQITSILPHALPLLSTGCASRDGVLQHWVMKSVRSLYLSLSEKKLTHLEMLKI